MANQTLADLFRGKAGEIAEAKDKQPKVLEMIASVFGKDDSGRYRDAQVAGPSLAFLATVIKDAGAIEEAIVFFQEALTVVPSSTSYALNYAHTLEILYLYDGARDVALSFLEANVGLSAPAALGSHRLSVREVVDVMRRWSVGSGDGGSGQGAALPAFEQDLFDVDLDKAPESILTKAYTMASKRSSSATTTEEWEIEWMQEKGKDTMNYAVARKNGSGKEEGKVLEQIVTALAASSGKLQQLSADELDLLALLFTVVKMAFLAGDLDLIGPLVALIEPVRVGRKLHHTSIRNEAAYYCCVAQLMEQVVTKRESIGLPKIYACGDSHVLPLAWQRMRVDGKETQIVPRLATGVKAWHLREESTFYPKRNFQSAVASIPKGAKAIFVFCEIDCREGIYVALEKARYKTLEQGIRAVVDIYVSVLLEIVKDPVDEATKGRTRRHICAEPEWRARGLTIYVHPVLPVLDVTRPLVLAFNEVLAAQVRKLRHPRIRWLAGLYEELLDGAGKLKQRYELDGTHIHPRYIGERLEPSLAAALGEKRRGEE